MALSEDLASLFAKTMKTEEPKKTESTAYGKVVTYNGNKYVQLDGSELLTPVTSTVNSKDGDRVTVMIKNHTAVVTGNVTAPAANTDDVDKIGNQISEFEIVIADKVSVKQLEAEIARTDSLTADNVVVKERLTATEASIDELEADNVTINEKLVANEAEIEELNTTMLKATDAELKYATIENLDATNAKVYNLETVYGNFEKLTAEELVAVKASIEELDAKKLSASVAEVTYATITNLKAAVADIESLDAEVADINTLMFGTASGGSLQTSFANALIAVLGEAQIKSAMIESLSASKLTAGTIFTNIIKMASESGHLVISDNTIQISDDNRVRVQIGLDASNDYSINVWDADGELMFSEGGITDSAIKEAIIRDDMVSDTANISATKLNISSLFTAINGATETIKSSQIFLDTENQTLDVAFKEMNTTVTEQGEKIVTQGAEITALSDQITSKIWQQDITTAVDGIEIGGRNLFQNSDFSNGKTSWGSVNGSTVSVTTIDDKNVLTATKGVDSDSLYHQYFSTYDNAGVEKEYVLSADIYVEEAGTLSSTLWVYSSGWRSSIKKRVWLTSNELSVGWNKVAVVLTAYNKTYTGKILCSFAYTGTTMYLYHPKIEEGNKPTSWTLAPEDTEKQISTLNTKYTEVQQDVDSISATVAAHTTEIESKADSSTVTAVQSQVTSLEATLDGFKTEVSETYVTQTEFDDLEIGGRNLILNSKFDKEYSTVWAYNANLTISFDNGYAEITKDESSARLPITQISSATSNGGLAIPEEGQTYTVSAEVKKIADVDIPASTGVMIRYYFTDGTYKGYQAAVPTDASDTEWVKISNTWTYSDERTVDRVQISVMIGSAAGGLCVRNMKLEKGNKATDWTPAPEDTEAAIDTVETQISESATTVLQTSEEYTIEALTKYVEQTEYSAFTEETAAQLQVLSDQITLKFTENSERTETVNDELVSKFTELEKYFIFNENGITIKTNSETELQLVMDNDMITFYKNGVQFGWWDGIDFHTGNIVVEVSERAQFGNFAFIPRSDGSLSLLKVGE